jgi:pimeloyl-ACP methyl ester carboxylesterase
LPVLIVHGDRDVPTLRENATLIQRQLPRAELVMIPNAGGHSLPPPILSAFISG